MNRAIMFGLLALIFLGVVVGQFFRIELFTGSAGGILALDIALAIAAPTVLWGLLTKKIGLPKRSAWPWLGAFLLVAILSFALNAAGRTSEEQLVGLGYLLRLIAYATAFLLGYWFGADHKWLLQRWFAYLLAGLISLGLVILAVMPDFSLLVALGWDPHQWRLSSTWLDPNYFGSFLAMAFVFLLALAPRPWRYNQTRSWLWMIGLLIIWAALYLTFSRSALFTVLVGGVLVSILISWRTFLVFFLLFAITFSLPSRWQDRLNQALTFTKNIDTPTAQADPTANARLDSWKRALEVTAQAPVLGIGYNFYQYAQRDLAIISEETVEQNRSAAGSDSSLLTVLATTGILGATAFIGFLAALAAWLWRRRKAPWALGSLGLLVAWFVSSWFNNTMLYPLILAPSLLILGAALHNREGDA